MNYLFETGYEIETPIPMITREGAKPFPPTGYRTMDARTNFFYGITGITPGMAMRLPGLGSQYLLGFMDADKQFFLQGHAAQGYSRGELLVVHTLRQHDALDARHAATLPASRQPELSLARCRTERRRLHNDLLRSDAACGGEARKLDSERSEERVVHDPAPLQPARAILYESVAAERDRTGAVTI